MDTNTAETGSPSRMPRQGRSRASFERMMQAAEQLMRERGTDEFTLLEVSKLGKVSIGSIYCRFDSKDALIHAIQERVLTQLEETHANLIEGAIADSDGLPALVANLIDATAETLRQFSPILGPIMLRSFTDTAMSALGRESYLKGAERVEQAILQLRAEITHPHPEHAAAAAYRIAYSAIARFLGFGSPTSRRADVMEWLALKQDLSVMCTAFLMIRPELVQKKR